MNHKAWKLKADKRMIDDLAQQRKAKSMCPKRGYHKVALPELWKCLGIRNTHTKAEERQRTEIRKIGLKTGKV